MNTTIAMKNKDIEVNKGQWVLLKDYDAVEQTLSNRMLIGKREDDTHDDLGLAWVDYFNNKVEEFDMRQAIVEQVTATNLVERSIISEVSKEGDAVKMILDVYYKNRVHQLKITYKKV